MECTAGVMFGSRKGGVGVVAGVGDGFLVAVVAEEGGRLPLIIPLLPPLLGNVVGFSADVVDAMVVVVVAVAAVDAAAAVVVVVCGGGDIIIVVVIVVVAAATAAAAAAVVGSGAGFDWAAD